MIINSRHEFCDNRILSIDALSIAEEELKAPITNTAMLGALLGVLKDVREEQILKAVEDYMPRKIAEKNKTVTLRSTVEIRQKGDDL